ncbi:MAG: SMC-Scp complex subunit ScpB, partial [Chloroflexota bacterium]|nr:SMC-Scp complex subunit ScpB [Chloroflexota bacterium]
MSEDTIKVTEKMNLELTSLIESLLFVADAPVTPAQLAAALEIEPGAVEAALEQLAVEYQQRGLRLQRKAGRVQLVTAPEAALAVERFLGLELSSKLSPAALEALA